MQVMNLVMSESCPADWKRSLLVSLHKDGDNEEVGKYREIALGCNGKGIYESAGEEVRKVFRG